MDLYTFTVEKFIITDTRAKINDTLALGYSAHVDGVMVDLIPFRLNPPDFNNGTYNVVDRLPSARHSPGLDRVVINDPEAKVTFNFQLINAGNTPDATLTGCLAATAEQLAGVLVGVASIGKTGTGFPGGGYSWVALGLEAVSYIIPWATANCDGPAAVDQIQGPRYFLDALTDNADHLIRFDQKYPGQDPPPEFCDVSHYEVIWSLSHQREWVQVEAFPAGADPVSFASETGV